MIEKCVITVYSRANSFLIGFYIYIRKWSKSVHAEDYLRKKFNYIPKYALEKISVTFC